MACYLSAEFLIGPQLGNNLVNLGIEDNARHAMQALGQDLDELLALEEEPGLGNGGLGRFAVCYLDSLATLAIPSVGYGIRYEFGIFNQEIRDGWQAAALRERKEVQALGHARAPVDALPATTCSFAPQISALRDHVLEYRVTRNSAALT